MYHSILIPTDGSYGAERGIDHGLEIADRFDADVYSLFVVDENIYGETPALSVEELQYEQLHEEGEEAVSEVLDRAENRGLDADGRVTRGEPVEEIIDYADECNADLIVMGVHGSGGADYPHVGHVTDRVIRNVGIPVMPV